MSDKGNGRRCGRQFPTGLEVQGQQGIPWRGLLLCLNKLFRTLPRGCNRQHGTISELQRTTSPDITKHFLTTTPTRNLTGQRWSYETGHQDRFPATYPCLGKGCFSLILQIYKPPGLRVNTQTVLPSGALMVAVLSVNSTFMPPSQILPTDIRGRVTRAI